VDTRAKDESFRNRNSTFSGDRSKGWRAGIVAIIAVTSGKGGVAKTLVAANLATALPRPGKQVLLLDTDFGLASLDVVFNIHCKSTLQDVLTGGATLDDAIGEVQDEISAIIDQLVNCYDNLFVDTAVGISDLAL
jgi:flagellar biosynthesis protein FlhG